MSQVAEFGKSLEEATENLNRLLGVLEDAHSQLEEVSSDFESNVNEWNQIAEKVGAGMESLGEALETAKSSLEQSEVTAELDTLQQTLTEVEGKFDESIQAVE